MNSKKPAEHAFGAEGQVAFGSNADASELDVPVVFTIRLPANLAREVRRQADLRKMAPSAYIGFAVQYHLKDDDRATKLFELEAVAKQFLEVGIEFKGIAARMTGQLGNKLDGMAVELGSKLDDLAGRTFVNE
jgi:hypothetical protein